MMTRYTVDSDRETTAGYGNEVEFDSRRVTAYGEGLVQGVVGETCRFKIHIGADSGEGTLSVAVVGPSKVPITFHNNKDRTCSITYLPTEPGQYNVTVTFADTHVPGSPFQANIIGKETDKTVRNEMRTLPLQVSEDDISRLSATIEKPSGNIEGCKLKRLSNGNLGIIFAIKESGEHIVNVQKDGQHVKNSPFKISVAEREVANASKVRVSELFTDGIIVGQIVQFFVDTTKAGFGILDVTIEGPSKTTVNLQETRHGLCMASYRPNIPGQYILNVKYSDHHVPGSPFIVNVEDESPDVLASRKVTSVVASKKRVCELELKIPDTEQKDLKAHVIDPTGNKVTTSIVGGPSFNYTIRFIPTMPGDHQVVVTYKGVNLSGSPFAFPVTSAGKEDGGSVFAVGPGLQGSGVVGEKSNFTILTNHVGPGKVTIGVDGPAKVKMEVNDKSKTSRQVFYTPTQPGDYLINIKYNDEHISNSPFRVFIRSPGDDSPATDMWNPGNDVIIAKVVSPSGAEDDCLITEFDGNYNVGFTPRTRGLHMIHVEINGEHLPNSPFSVLVGGVSENQKMVHFSLTKKTTV